jgi:hypothetical protein
LKRLKIVTSTVEKTGDAVVSAADEAGDAIISVADDDCASITSTAEKTGTVVASAVNKTGDAMVSAASKTGDVVMSAANKTATMMKSTTTKTGNAMKGALTSPMATKTGNVVKGVLNSPATKIAGTLVAEAIGLAVGVPGTSSVASEGIGMITGSLKKTQSLPEKANQKQEVTQEKNQPQKVSQASQQSIAQNQQQFAISQSLINQQLAAQQQFILASSATGSQQQIALTRPLMVMPQFGPQGTMESGIVLPSAGTSLRPQMPQQYYSSPATLQPQYPAYQQFYMQAPQRIPTSVGYFPIQQTPQLPQQQAVYPPPWPMQGTTFPAYGNYSAVPNAAGIIPPNNYPTPPASPPTATANVVPDSAAKDSNSEPSQKSLAASITASTITEAISNLESGNTSLVDQIKNSVPTAALQGLNNEPSTLKSWATSVAASTVTEVVSNSENGNTPSPDQLEKNAPAVAPQGPSTIKSLASSFSTSFLTNAITDFGGGNPLS